MQAPRPTNERVLDYAPGSPERLTLKARLLEMQRTRIELPLVIDGKDVRTGWFEDAIAPHDHRQVLALAHLANATQMDDAIAAAERAAPDWSRRSWEARAPRRAFLPSSRRRSEMAQDEPSRRTILVEVLVYSVMFVAELRVTIW